MEIWKDVVGLEDYYQVSNKGSIRRKAYQTVSGDRHIVEAHIVKPMICTNGYYEATFMVHGKRIVKLLHRVVAEAFIPNPDLLPEVNHRDEDLSNNRVDNLEWCTSKYNANYGGRNRRVIETKKKTRSQVKSVNQLSLDGEFIKHWDMIADAARHVGVDSSAIIRVCKGKQRTSAGYRWEYAS